MRLAEYAQYDGLGLADLVRTGQVTAAELAALAVEAVDKVNPQIHAVIQVYRERVGKAGELVPMRRAPFAGVPFLLKDIGAAEAGQTQEMGSRLAQGYLVQAESYLTRRFKEAGLIILGRTATPEFATSGTTESILTGATCNPWNLSRIAGGSSGGAAAAVAAGILPVAHASDAGGSIRIPAACCGLVGLKPSRGRVSLGPDLDESMCGMGQEFVVSRTVRDTAAMLDAVGRPEAGDPFVIAQPARPHSDEIGEPVAGLRVAFTADSWFGYPIDPNMAEAVRQVAGQCRDLGLEVEEAAPRFDVEAHIAVVDLMFGVALVHTCDRVAEAMGRAVDADHVEPINLAYYRQAKGLTLSDYSKCLEGMNRVRRQVGEFFRKHDLLLSPTVAGPAAQLGTLSVTQEIPYEEWVQRSLAFYSHTDLFNVTGQPAISLPLGQSETDMPLGVQFAARSGEESMLIRMASALEEAMPWRERLPAVHVSR